MGSGLVFSEVEETSHASSAIFTDQVKYPEPENPGESDSTPPELYELKLRTLLESLPQ